MQVRISRKATPTKIFVKHKKDGPWELYYTDLYVRDIMEKLKYFPIRDDGCMKMGYMILYSVMFASGNIWSVKGRKYEYILDDRSTRRRAHDFLVKLQHTFEPPKIWLWRNYLRDLELMKVPRGEKYVPSLVDPRFK